MKNAKYEGLINFQKSIEKREEKEKRTTAKIVYSKETDRKKLILIIVIGLGKKDMNRREKERRDQRVRGEKREKGNR